MFVLDSFGTERVRTPNLKHGSTALSRGQAGCAGTKHDWLI
jgi:hypothetical protein